MIPSKYIPKKIIIIAMIFEKNCDLLSRKDPKKVEDAPRKIKIIEKPKTKSKDFCKIKYLDFFWSFSRSVPQINDKYPGIKGRTQGDKKLIIPAKKLKNNKDINYEPKRISSFPREFSSWILSQSPT